MKDGFNRRKEQSRAAVRAAARRLFDRYGFEKVSLADIARQANVSQATIYNHFGSKEAVVRAYVTETIDLLVNRAQAALAAETRFPDKLAGFVQFIAGMLEQGEPPAADAALASRDLLWADPEIRAVHAAARERMADLLLGLAREGQAQGYVSSEIPEAALRMYFMAFMEMFAAPHFRLVSARDPGLVEALGQLMLSGLCGAGRPGERTL